MIDIHEHVGALLAAITAKGVRVYDTKVGQNFDGTVDATIPPNYAVAYMDGGLRSAASLADDHEEQSDFDGEFYSVGTTPKQARWVQSRVLSVVGSTLTVAGRSTIVRHVFSDRVQRDTDNPQQVVFQARDGLTLVSLKG